MYRLLVIRLVVRTSVNFEYPTFFSAPTSTALVLGKASETEGTFSNLNDFSNALRC